MPEWPNTEKICPKLPTPSKRLKKAQNKPENDKTAKKKTLSGQKKENFWTKQPNWGNFGTKKNTATKGFTICFDAAGRKKKKTNNFFKKNLLKKIEKQSGS